LWVQWCRASGYARKRQWIMTLVVVVLMMIVLVMVIVVVLTELVVSTGESCVCDGMWLYW
jgi:maltodextrin utilization protein YvdJ